VLGLWDDIATLLHDVEGDVKRVQFGSSLLGLDLTDFEGRELHQHIVKVLRVYVDRQRALEMFGALKSGTQTLIENEAGRKLLPELNEPAATLDEIRSLAQRHEVREANRDKDAYRLLRSMGIPVKKLKAKAAAKQTTGRPRDDDEVEWDSEEEWSGYDEEWSGYDGEDEVEEGTGATCNEVKAGSGDSANATAEKEKEKAPKASGSIDLDALFTAISACRTATDSDDDEERVNDAEVMKRMYLRRVEENASNGD
jgi:hypothetical protein